MTDIQFWLRLMVLTVYGAAVVLCLIALVKRPRHRLWAVAPLSLATHVVAFYIVVLLRTPLQLTLSPVVLNQWSAAIYVHAGVLIFVGVWLFLWPARGNR